MKQLRAGAGLAGGAHRTCKERARGKIGRQSERSLPIGRSPRRKRRQPRIAATRAGPGRAAPRQRRRAAAMPRHHKGNKEGRAGQPGGARECLNNPASVGPRKRRRTRKKPGTTMPRAVPGPRRNGTHGSQSAPQRRSTRTSAAKGEVGGPEDIVGAFLAGPPIKPGINLCVASAQPTRAQAEQGQPAREGCLGHLAWTGWPREPSARPEQRGLRLSPDLGAIFSTLTFTTEESCCRGWLLPDVRRGSLWVSRSMSSHVMPWPQVSGGSSSNWSESEAASSCDGRREPRLDLPERDPESTGLAMLLEGTKDRSRLAWLG